MLLLDGEDKEGHSSGPAGLSAVWVTMDKRDKKYQDMFGNHKEMVEQVPAGQTFTHFSLHAHRQAV